MPAKTITLCFMILCAGCLPTPGPKPKDMEAGRQKDPIAAENLPAGEREPFTVFLTGNILSTIKPCGCAEGQLGGFDRRQAVLSTAPENRRLIIDTGNLLMQNTEQDMIKLDIIIQAMTALGYDLLNLTEQDIIAAGDMEILQRVPFKIISPVQDGEVSFPKAVTRQFDLGGEKLSVTTATIQTDLAETDALKEMFSAGSSGMKLNILIADNCNEEFINIAAQTQLVDVVVCPTSADEPEVLSKKGDRPLVVTVGRLGKYVGRLAVSPKDNGECELTYTKTAVTEQLALTPELSQLYRDYQLIVKQAHLLEKTRKVPLPDNLEYLGSASCKMCHEYEYKAWTTKKHAQAYQTLVDVGSQYDPECIVCHVVGLNYETGFVNDKSQFDLKNVGCEVCHGPGSKHMVATVMEQPDRKTSEPKTRCYECHSPEHSPGFQGHEKEYLEKITHWREPLVDWNVKEYGLDIDIY